MEKDFDGWNILKKSAHAEDHLEKLFFKEREIWWCKVGVNIGFEEDGKNIHFTRPVLILKKLSKRVFIGVPLSTTLKRGKYYYDFKFKNATSVALLSQLRLFDVKRLADKMGRITETEFERIREAVKSII